MDKATRRRGSRDTWRLIGLVSIALSLVVHASPFALYFFAIFLSLIQTSTGNDAPGYKDHPTIIPIEFGFESGEQPGSPKPKSTVTTLEDPVDPDEKKPPAGDGPDAGVAMDGSVDVEVVDAGEDEKPAPLPDAQLAPDAAIAQMNLDASKELDAGGPIASASDAGADAAPGFKPIPDPIGVSGAAKAVTPKHPNVKLTIYTSRIRRHQLSAKFAPTLTKLKQWKAFFRSTGIDPIQDTDRILLAGPQFRDTSRIVAVLRYNAPEARMRQAITALATAGGHGGGWIKKGPVPAAKVHVDGAERYFVLAAPKILVIVPPDGLDQAYNVKGFPAGQRNQAVLLFLVNPRNAFRGMAFDIPATLKWMRFSLSVTNDGGADARIEAEDKDAATASESAAKVTRGVDQLRQAASNPVMRLLLGGRPLLDPVTFRADGKLIRAQTHLTQRQLNSILALVATQVEQAAKAGTKVGAPTPPKGGKKK